MKKKAFTYNCGFLERICYLKFKFADESSILICFTFSFPYAKIAYALRRIHIAYALERKNNEN